MANSLSTLLSVILRPTLTTDNVGSYAPSIELNKSYPSGTSADQMDRLYINTRTIAASGSPQDLDLAGGSLLDPDQQALTFVKITTIIVRSLAANAGEIISVGGGSNPFISWLIATGDGIKIGKDGLFLIHVPSTDAFTVTPGTGDILRLSVNTGTNVQAAVAIVGRSA